MYLILLFGHGYVDYWLIDRGVCFSLLQLPENYSSASPELKQVESRRRLI